MRFVWFAPVSSTVGTMIWAAGVNVGKRVGVSGAIKAAASVGSIVGVEKGVGVGGASTVCNRAPGLIRTYGAYTQAFEPGTPG